MFEKEKLTCVVQSSGDGCSGPLGTELRHATLSLYSERVVEMRVQVTNNNCGVLQVRRSWLKADLLAAGDARGLVTEFAHHSVHKVTATPSHQWWAPEQLQLALPWQSHGGKVTRGTRWS